MKITIEELCIQEIESFYNLLKNEISNVENMELSLDFKDVKKVDLCAVQLLISLKEYCQNINIDLIFINIESKQILQTIETFNLANYFGISHE